MPDQTCHTLVVTACYTGMRAGELLGLDRRNVLLDEAALVVDPLAGARCHKMAGIDAVYDHVTAGMQPALLVALQRRWDDSGSYW